MATFNFRYKKQSLLILNIEVRRLYDRLDLSFFVIKTIHINFMQQLYSIKYFYDTSIFDYLLNIITQWYLLNQNNVFAQRHPYLNKIFLNTSVEYYNIMQGR